MNSTNESPCPMPADRESEKALLHCIMLCPELLTTVARERLDAEDFYEPLHRSIYAAMLELADDGVPIEIRTVASVMEPEPERRRKAVAYLALLDAGFDQPAVSSAVVYAEIVQELAVRRRLIELYKKMIHATVSGQCRAREALAHTEAAILAMGAALQSSGPEPLDAITDGALEQLENRGDGLLGLSTGYPVWDRISQGLVASNLIILAGRPGMGKTSLALNVAVHVAAAGQRVVIFSLEMSRHELLQRIWSAESGLPFSRVRDGRLNVDQWQALHGTVENIRHLPLYIDDDANPTITDLAGRVRRLQRKDGVGLVIVDYLQLMQPVSGRREPNRQLEVAAMSRGLKQLAKELEVPVLAVSQLSRQPEHRGNHRPQLADLRDSGAIEQDADMVCFVYRDEVYNTEDPDNKGLAELIVAKHRNGPTGKVDLVFLAEEVRFASAGWLSPPGSPQGDRANGGEYAN